MNIFYNVSVDLLKGSQSVIDFLNTEVLGYTPLMLISFSGLVVIFGLCLGHLLADW